MSEKLEGKREWHDRDLRNAKYVMRYLRDSTKEMERINIREREKFYDMEGTRLGLLEIKLNMDTRESEIRKVHLNMENSVTYICIGHQEGCQ